jgi:excisionase family DNA binding protein
MPKPDPITVKQAAEILDCSAAHVRLLCSRGRIEAKRFGIVLLVNPTSVAYYLKHERQFHKGRPRKKTRRNKR